jgi:hypothetical protein
MSDLPLSFFPVFILQSCMHAGGVDMVIQQAVVKGFVANGGGRFGGSVRGVAYYMVNLRPVKNCKELSINDKSTVTG